MPIPNKAKEADRILSRIERNHDKRNAPLRSYMQDRNDVARLAREGLIDKDHYDILVGQIERTYAAAKQKQRTQDYKDNPRKAPQMPPPASNARYIMMAIAVILFTIYFLAR